MASLLLSLLKAALKLIRNLMKTFILMASLSSLEIMSKALINFYKTKKKKILNKSCDYI